MFNCSRLSRTQTVLLTHGDSVERVGDKLKVGGRSSNNIVTAVYNEVLRIYGVQFHPEVDLTVSGKQIFTNFLFDICGLTPNFTMGSRKEECIKYVKEKVGNNKVLVSFFLVYIHSCVSTILIYDCCSSSSVLPIFSIYSIVVAC